MHDSRPDADLIAALNRGDDAAFAALYHRYRDWIVRLATRWTGNDADALDVLQETWRYVLSKCPRLVLTASMTTFLYPVVRNLSIAARKKRHRSVTGADASALDLPAPSLPPEPGSQRALLAEVIRNLPDTHREVVLMRFVDDMSLEEIAAALAVPLGTVKSRLHNALARLRDDPRTQAYFR